MIKRDRLGSTSSSDRTYCIWNKAVAAVVSLSGKGVVSRNDRRKGYFSVVGSRPGEFGSVKEGIAEKVTSQCYRPYTSNSPGPHCTPEVNPSGIQSLPVHPQQLQPQETSEQQQEQELQPQQQQHREATAYHGAAIGQTGTSTRQELTAWIRVLAVPCRSMYATDSASMLNKALRLIQAADRNLRETANGAITRRGNPFGKAWGLQVDGDLWEQAWNAVLSRGIGNQYLMQVKGHATEEDVSKGLATSDDREGNDISDKLADNGVEQVAGIRLVKLGKWCERGNEQLQETCHAVPTHDRRCHTG